MSVIIVMRSGGWHLELVLKLNFIGILGVLLILIEEFWV